MRTARVWAGFSAFLLSGLWGCSSETVAPPPIRITSQEAGVEITLSPFSLRVLDAGGQTVLESAKGEGSGAYGGPAATDDAPSFLSKTLPGWDGYVENPGPWRRVATASVREERADGVTLEFVDEAAGLFLVLDVSVKGPRVRVALDARERADAAAPNALDKTSLSFVLREDEHFFGLGERFASVDHRGLSLYTYAEEGGLGQGEDAPAGPLNPNPNGPSMTYFPVPFFLSSAGYGVHLDTTYRTELHFGSEDPSSWRAAANSRAFAATVYVHADPLATIADYTKDTGRAPVPAPWVFGPRRRSGRATVVNGTPEWLLMRQQKIAVTSIDDAVHFLPALSHVGVETELQTWTTNLHAAGYKAMAYNNPYVAQNHPNAATDYAFGKENGFFVKKPDGEPALTEFVSGELLRVAAVDLTNPQAVAWFQDLLRRTLSLGYDGWMHDFGEYVPRDAVFFDGRRGDEVHNEYPVLSAKAAHDLLEAERPGDYLFFVRSGGSGTQAFVPAVWGGDAEATFDETQGLPSSVRGGLNLSLSGVPYWGSDMTGFKCLTSAPNDKEVFLRWVEFGAVSPIMMEQNACVNPITKKQKWTMWSDAETTDHYRKYALLHTRLAPYFELLAKEASETGQPISIHPFLLHPTEPEAWKVEDAYFLGRALYASPVVRRGKTSKETWLPKGARYVDFDDFTVYEGGGTVSLPAPLGKLPLLLVSGQILPMLDPSVETLAPATDPAVVTASDVADRLDVRVALSPGETARLVLADGTELEASRSASNQGNPGSLSETTAAEIGACAKCFVAASEGDVQRMRANSDLAAGSDVVIEDLHLVVKGGPSRRVRWDVLRLVP